MEEAGSIATLVVCALGAILALILQRRYQKEAALQVARQTPNEPFAWPRGKWLQSLDEATIRLPGSIILGREKTGDIIELSDSSTPVKFNHADDGKTLESITIKLRAGSYMRVNRQCDAMVIAADDMPRRFKLVEEPA